MININNGIKGNNLPAGYKVKEGDYFAHGFSQPTQHQLYKIISVDNDNFYFIPANKETAERNWGGLFSYREIKGVKCAYYALPNVTASTLTWYRNNRPTIIIKTNE